MKRLKRLIKTASVIEWSSIDFHKDDAQDKFSEIWEDLEDVLTAIVDLRITGKKSDKRIKKLINLGNMIYEGDFEKFPEFTDRLRKRWGLIRGIISLSIWVSSTIDSKRGDKAAQVLSQFIEIGDWLTGGANS